MNIWALSWRIVVTAYLIIIGFYRVDKLINEGDSIIALPTFVVALILVLYFVWRTYSKERDESEEE